MGSYINLSLIKLLILSIKYKLIFINEYLRNAIKYILIKKFVKNKKNINLEEIKKLRTNLFLKKRSFQDIIKGLNIFLDPLNSNLTHLDLRDTIKINSPFLKVSRVQEILEKEGLKKLELFCKRKDFNYKNIMEHQKSIAKV